MEPEAEARWARQGVTADHRTAVRSCLGNTRMRLFSGVWIDSAAEKAYKKGSSRLRLVALSITSAGLFFSELKILPLVVLQHFRVLCLIGAISLRHVVILWPSSEITSVLFG